MRYTGPKTRLCRRHGINLFGSDKYQKIMGRKPHIPGMHGHKRAKKLTEYGTQLFEKQKLKRIFGITEKQLSRYFDKASRSKSVTGTALLELMELRLDNAVFRAGFANTRMQARQFVGHGHFLLNGRRVDIPSIMVKPGDIIEVRPKSKNSPIFKKNLSESKESNFATPKWIDSDFGAFTFKTTGTPEVSEMESSIELHMIVEFYSR